ncbi:MAG: hypothetical protein K1X95_12440 [Acidimicrobiia bacterium]|nr:hypothetical protein [Acidimicrobiia bacterium]
MRSERLARTCLVLLAIPDAIVGVWAAFWPASFYASFPGFGRVWISVDGPFNEHLVRDVGQLNLALCLVLVVAAVRPTVVLVRAAAGASLVVALPHFVYHVSHLSTLGTGDAWGEAVSLALVVLLACTALVAAAPRGEPGADTDANTGLGAQTAP